MTSDDHEEAQPALALARYEIIGRYLALDPPRGQRRQVLEQLAAKPWPWVGGDPIEVSAETLRVWIRRFPEPGAQPKAPNDGELQQRVNQLNELREGL